ncbi:MAG: gluconokinase [Rubrobacter sp.]|nr:gluconokinase [Rubrobacter sp.]
MNSTSGKNRAALSIDIGSSSVRASLYDTSGEPIPGAEAKLDHDLEYDSDGAATKNPDELLDLTARAVDEAMSKGGGYEIIGVAMCTFWHSLLGVGHDGTPTTPVFTWADRRSAVAANELRARLDEGAVHRRTGCVLHSSYWPAKLSWLENESPEAFEKSERWISPGEYIYLRLFGETSVGTSMASANGLFEQNEKRWDEEILEAIRLPEDRLSPVSDAPMRGLRGEWAERWPKLAEVPWFPAVGDGAASNVGCGCVDEGKLALMVGTSGAMRILWKAEAIEVPPGVWRYRADSERVVMGGALSNGGNLVEWLRDTLRLPEPDEAEKLLAEMGPDSHGLTFLPLLAGERGPGWADRANGVVAGLSMASEPMDILRAAMESVALRFAIIAGMLEKASSGEKEVIATGGGLVNSPAWTRIMADALGRPVKLSNVEEASSRGAALLALEKLGEIEIDKLSTPPGETFAPDEKNHETYMNALERQKRLYGAVL